MKKNLKLRKNIFILGILLLMYFAVDFLPHSKTYKKRQSREVEVAENIKTLKATTSKLDSMIQADKDALNDLFYNNKPFAKLDGLIKSNPTDLTLKINDNLDLVLQKEGYPVKVHYKKAEFEMVDSRAGLSDDKNVTMTKDVRVIENPNEFNEYELIHDLKTYLVDAYGEKAFETYLDKYIEDQIRENEVLIEKISKTHVNTEETDDKDGK